MPDAESSYSQATDTAHFDGEAAQEPHLEQRAYELASRHAVVREFRQAPELLERLKAQEAALQDVYWSFRRDIEEEAPHSYAAEWLLDNFYVVQQAIRQIEEDMPGSYYRQLPKLREGLLRGLPRVYDLTREMAQESAARIDLERVSQFVTAYQEVMPLTMGELWALPTMLRLVVIDGLLQSLALLVGTAAPEGQVPPMVLPADVPPDAVVANCILSLRALAVQDWKAFFEDVSLVEQVLSQDPARVYERMDFDTRDQYRKVVEDIGLAPGQSEVAVARQAVELARRAEVQGGVGPKVHHVGYYLVDRGRRLLEKELSYRPPLDGRLGRWLLGRPTFAYLAGIIAITLLLLLGYVGYAEAAGATQGQLLVVILLTLMPAVTVAVSLVNWLVMEWISPSVLPKMDFKNGVPDEYRTMVVVPALLTGAEEVESLLRQLELHFLRNPDPNMYFALLTDFGDAPEEHMPGDETLLAQARMGVETLNARYRRASGAPFFLLHRARRWNPREGVWMGWERKRGKLEEFNRLVLGKGETSFTDKVADLGLLSSIRYAITLDADTILPKGSAQRLIGSLAHPLNEPEFDRKTGEVTAGYTILQPRTEVQPGSANQSLFSRVFAGDTGLDLYTRAVSDVYQDLFGEGIFVGKGIYDVAAFERSLEGRVPENALLSHDLFEGIQGRAGLVTDIVLYEDFPARYLEYAQRLQRWIRGDWQLLPWLLPGLSSIVRGQGPSHMAVIDRWKILDNLRRSLVAPALLTLLVMGWLALPGSVWFWALVALLTPAVSLVVSLLHGLRTVSRRSLRGLVRSARMPGLRWILSLIFLPYEALITLQAVINTLRRVLVTRRHLLEWRTAAHTARLFGDHRGRVALIWSQMIPSLLLSLGLGALVGALNPAALPAATPLLLAWLVSPQVVYWISRPRARRAFVLGDEQERLLRSLARRTWLYFEQFVGPEDHWLPPDHFQEEPRGTVAHRTSPTNIGLALLSTLAAYDMGYIDLLVLSLRLRDTFRSLDQLERYRGHVLNWYDTRTLKPLLPRYVSTVDSGNLAGCLLALRQGCLELVDAPVFHSVRWQGLLDTLTVLGEVTQGLGEVSPEEATAVQSELGSMRRQVESIREDHTQWARLLVQFLEEDWPALEQRLADWVEQYALDLPAATLGDLRLSSARARSHLADMYRQVNILAPWLIPMSQPPSLFLEVDPNSELAATWQALVDELSGVPPLNTLGQLWRTVEAHLTHLLDQMDRFPAPDYEVAAARDWCNRLAAGLSSAPAAAAGILVGLDSLSKRAAAYVRDMDFGFLFDPQRQVFHIGYNVDAEKPDPNYYDLLASEARIASLIAIAKEDVSEQHWLYLGRPLTLVRGMRTLLSWNGSMFEYLMPILLLRQYDDTLLTQSVEAVVLHQIDYARSKRVPWGISESGYYHFDNQMNYQYRGFGVPGLGFKRGLADDLVITPYASLLCLPVHPEAALENLGRLTELGMLGTYGFYESIDYTPAHLPLGKRHAIVRSFMVHHQGMILLSLLNYLEDDPMVRRLHSDPQIQSVELLLQEQIPEFAPVEEAPEEETAALRIEPVTITATPWHVPVQTPYPEAHFLSNGRYGVLITNAGSGYSRWQDADLTRWRADTTLDNWGAWLYIQDLASGHLWSAASQPIPTPPAQREVVFYPHEVNFQCTVDQVATQMEIVVSPEDDVEIRRIRITNQGDRPRRLMLTSYAEVILAPQDADRRHPAFNKLFIESHYLREMNALIFHRRPRSGEEPSLYLVHALLTRPGVEPSGAYETDRDCFLGRGGTFEAPAALAPDGPGLMGTTGAVLDPIMAIAQTVEIEPHGTVEVAYLGLAADSRQGALDLAQRYRDWVRIERAFDQARSQSEVEMRQLELDTMQLRRIQHLLSLLHYPAPALRADPQTLAANHKGQPDLWAYGISGDYPILLVHLTSQEDSALVHELLRAHMYWRNRGLEIDLVILNEKERGYTQELQGHLLRLVRRLDSEHWLNRRGGLFLLGADGMPEADRVLLRTVARVVLDARDGTLVEQMERLRQRPLPLPAFVPTGREAEEETSPVARPEDLLFDNGLGGFSPDGCEYVVYLAPGEWTPAPWANVAANPDFGFLITEAGGGYSWAINSGENRLTPWSNDPVRDPPGEALYLRDEETAEVWSPLPLPVRAAAPYLVRHGAGYSIFEHHSHGLRQQVRLFAAHSAPVKVVHLRLENVWQRPRRLTATYYAEWVLGVNRDQMQAFVVPEYARDSHALLASNPYNAEFAERVAFVATSKEPHGVTADRTEFLGRLGGLHRPAALGRVGLAGRVEAGDDPCAAVQLHIDLDPGGSEEVFFLIGQAENREAALSLVEEFQSPERVAAAWQAALGFWDDLLGVVSVDTPDPAMNLLLNRWLLYQDLACRIWGRSAFYQSSGAYGFRDQLQDVMALVNAAPELAREHILRAARHQFEAGDVLHWWHPPSGRGVRARISDDLLWLPFVTAHYVVATGDTGILKEKVPFVRGESLRPEEEERYGHYETTGETYTLYEHCRRAIQQGSTAGPHDLPLIRAGDWNDGMNRVGIEGRGESIWLGWFLYATLMDFAPMCQFMGDETQARDYRRQAQELRRALHAHAWDGEWYLRGYYDDGTPLGSAQSLECQIDSIAQSWAVLSGAGDPERMERAMAAVREHLVREQDRLLLLFTPPFDRAPQDPGYIKGYPPGIRENGGQYTHAALWAVWAWAELGQGDRAEALFRLLNPVYHADTPEKVQQYRVEPYVVAADVYGAAPHVGRGGWTWYTGSGGWMYRLGLEAILGLRRVGDALRVEPHIPRQWSGYQLNYHADGADLHIRVENPDGVNAGVRQVVLDGELLPDGQIPVLRDGRSHEVRVVLGTRRDDDG
jgi:cyclic beta-1,2-glucan synthetase